MSVMRLAGLAACFLAAAGVGPVVAGGEKPGADDYYRVGLEHKAARQYDKARDSFVKAIRRNDRHVAARVELAWVLNEQGRFEDASLVAFVALLKDPGSAAGWRERGYAELRLKDYDEAEKALQAARKIDPLDKVAEQYLQEVRQAKAAPSAPPLAR